MTGMIAQLLAWPTLGVALLVFGFAPGAVLRLIVLFYRCDNPRRQELLGELYGVPRIERPFWVAEQLEVALFEGLRDRIRARRDWRTQRRDDALGRRLGTLRVEGSEMKEVAEMPTRPRTPLSWSLLDDDVARGWPRWRGAQPETPTKPTKPTKEDHDPAAGA